jgi:hypothetical protein
MFWSRVLTSWAFIVGKTKNFRPVLAQVIHTQYSLTNQSRTNIKAKQQKAGKALA